MERSGWELQPAGWILLIVATTALIWFIAKSLQRSSDEDRQDPA